MIRIFQLALLAIVSFAVIVVGYNWWHYIRPAGEQVAAEFRSADGTVLSGVLFKPAVNDPAPAIVLLHGSGPASGTPPFVTAHANAFLRHGIAVLSYDKRGSGASGGNFDAAGYADFIEDALAALSYLRSRSDIDASRLAVFGSSESGWFTPEIAARDGQVRFIINRCGPPLPWIETNLWEIRNELLEAGLDDESELTEFLDLRREIWDYYANAASARSALPNTRAKLEARLAKVNPQWLEVTSMRVADFDRAKFEDWTADIAYDPTAYLEQLAIPLYAVFAGADQNVPTAAAVKVLDDLRDEAGKHIELVVFPGYRHSLFKPGNLFWLGYPPSYLAGIAGWADEQFRQLDGANPG